MVSRKQSNQPPKPRRPAARTPEERENQLIALADELAEQQLRDGTASAQVITHYLKLGSSREKLEQAKMQGDIKLNEVKMEAIASQQRVEALFSEAIRAFSSYSGNQPQAIEGPDDFQEDE